MFGQNISVGSDFAEQISCLTFGHLSVVRYLSPKPNLKSVSAVMERFPQIIALMRCAGTQFLWQGDTDLDPSVLKTLQEEAHPGLPDRVFPRYFHLNGNL
jgi:hypothetical protein